MNFTPTRAFVPARGLASGHAQTIYASVVRSARLPPVRRERWDTPDGDFLDVDVLEAPATAPHLVVLHGLEGSSRAGYVAAILRGAHARGWGALAMNFRSCSGEPNRLAHSYHSGLIEDPLFVVGRLKERVSGPIAGVGFSLGGNVLTRLVGVTGERCPLAASAAVSVPFDLQVCARTMDGSDGWMRLYRGRFLKSLKQKAIGKAHRFSGFDVAKIRAIRGIEAFDDLVTAPQHGFGTAARYYAECSSGPVVSRIRRPTLLLSAKDDPLIPGGCVPEAAWSNPFVSVVLTDQGGHVGFVERSPLRPAWWGEAQVLAFLDGALSAAG
ncbi:MAG: YheT family hydrolase [Myxococcales bacterium]